MPEIICPANMDPNDPAALEEMKRRAGLIDQENTAGGVSASDLTDLPAGGLRPITAGVMAILEKIKSPIVTGSADPGMSEMLTVAFILDPEVPETELVDLAFAEDRDAIRKAAARWALSLTVDQMSAMIDQVTQSVNQMSDDLKLYTDPDAKKRISALGDRLSGPPAE